MRYLVTQTKTHRSSRQTFNAAGFKRGYGSGPIGRFYHDFETADCPLFSMFSIVKYFRQDTREPCPPLAEIIGPRLAPAPAYQVASALADARRDFVLPDAAPRTITSMAELIAAFDIIPPLKRDVMVEVKYTLQAGAAPHHAYEAVRSFAFKHFAHERDLAAMMVLHLPGKSGSKARNHIHLFVPARRLTEEGFGVGADNLVHDEGCAEVAAAWNKWRRVIADAGPHHVIPRAGPAHGSSWVGN